MPIDPTNSTLLSRLRDGRDEDAAWREFDATYRDLIRRYCSRCGLQAADAEDVQQIVMTRLAKSLPQFRYSREVGRFRDYLGRTVKNAILRQRERSARKPQPLPESAIDVLASNRDEPDDVWDVEWMHDHFRRALQKAKSTLDSKSVQVFELLLAGDKPKRLAVTFGMSEAAIYKIKQRVRDRLKDLVAKQLRDEEFEER